MAELVENNYEQIENPGAYYPQDYYLQTLNFLTASGQRFELKKIMLEMSYYEDIYSFAVSGYITVSDAQGLVEMLQLTGNEFIEVNFGKTKNGANSTDRLYRVYKVGDRKPSGNMNSEVYTLYFCSEELILSEQTKISKSYTGTKISDIISNILVDKLKVDVKQKIVTIEETTGVYDFIVPRLKPFEAISWLSTYARPNKAGSIGADMLFFETKNGFNYRSLQSMFKDDIYSTYKYQVKNIEKENQSFQEKTITVLDYEFVKVYDMMEQINSGAFANRLISIDTTTKTANTTDFNYTKYKKQAQTLNGNAPSNQLLNRLGKTEQTSYEGSFKIMTGNAQHQNSAYIKQVPGAFAKNIAVETYVPNRTAQISLANYNVLKLKIPGDTGITAGRTINFNLLSLKPVEKKELDKYYSGKYLVTAVRHIIQPTVFQTILEVAKDSSPTPIGGVNNTSAEYNVAIKK
jgi:hypothetical protein